MKSPWSHPQINVPGIDESVDAGLEHTLRFFVRQGIGTVFSCQGDPGDAHVVFSDAVSYETAVAALTNLAAAAGEHAVTSRILRRPNVGPPLTDKLVVFEPGQLWKHEVFLQPLEHRVATTTRPIFRWSVADRHIVERLCRDAS